MYIYYLEGSGHSPRVPGRSPGAPGHNPRVPSHRPEVAGYSGGKAHPQLDAYTRLLLAGGNERLQHARPLGEGRRIACYCGCKSPKSIPRSIPKVYPGVYQKCCRSAHYAFVGFVFVIMCSYFLLFVCSRCLLMILGSVVIV